MEELRKDEEERRERTQLRAAFWQVNDIAVSCDEELILDSRPRFEVEGNFDGSLTNLALRSTDRSPVQAS